MHAHGDRHYILVFVRGRTACAEMTAVVRLITGVWCHHDELDIEPTLFARQMAELGCRLTHQYVPTEDGATRRVRGYLIAD